MKYWWELAVKHNGASKFLHHRHVYVRWKPLLWFVKGTSLRVPDSINDLIESEPPDKILHEWEQSPVEAEHVISKLTVENGVVLDPLMAIGTTGTAALNLNRQFVGIDKDPEAFQRARERIDRLLLSLRNDR